MRHAFNGLLLVFVTFVACLAGACSSDGGSTGAGGAAGMAGSGGSGTGGQGGSRAPGTTRIGELGGVAESVAGDGSVSVPSGAIESGALDISVEQRSRDDFPDPGNRWSDVFELGPDGASFEIPVTVAITLDDDRSDSPAALFRLNESTEVWEEIALSYTTQGRVWGQVTGFSIFAAGPASAPDECTSRSSISMNVPGNVGVLVADRDQTTFVGVGTLFEQETGSRWITTSDSFVVEGIAGPPEGQGGWIDFATGPNFETGTFTIASDGTFSIPFDIPPLGFRYLGLTDACLAPFASETNGWLYNAEVNCGPNCGQNVNAPPCQFPETVTMQQVGMSSAVSASFSFLADEECTLQQPMGLVRQLTFGLDVFGVRDVVVIAGLNRWTILSCSEGRELIAGGRWVDFPDGVDITMTVRDADDQNAPIYEMIFRFDGNDLTVRSFIET